MKLAFLAVTGKTIILDDKNILFRALHENTNISSLEVKIIPFMPWPLYMVLMLAGTGLSFQSSTEWYIGMTYHGIMTRS